MPDGWKLLELLTLMEMMKDFMYMIDGSGFTVTESVLDMDDKTPPVTDVMGLPCERKSLARSGTWPVAGSTVKFRGRMKAAVHETVTTDP